MAERINKRQTESAKALIQTQRHIQELQAFIFGEREMDANQVRAACYLIDQSIGKALQTTDIDMDGNLEINVVRYASNDTQ